ncbi:hypothetical protein PG997_005702 [Apiospora hydei]|uniref:Uncharacterized protein n=1 Tax=Apiospora hydei TaxID=1337664 RepID=A0ABR1WLL4_9PEZI
MAPDKDDLPLEEFVARLAYLAAIMFPLWFIVLFAYSGNAPPAASRVPAHLPVTTRIRTRTRTRTSSSAKSPPPEIQRHMYEHLGHYAPKAPKHDPGGQVPLARSNDGVGARAAALAASCGAMIVPATPNRSNGVFYLRLLPPTHCGDGLDLSAHRRTQHGNAGLGLAGQASRQEQQGQQEEGENEEEEEEEEEEVEEDDDPTR